MRVFLEAILSCEWQQVSKAGGQAKIRRRWQHWCGVESQAKCTVVCLPLALESRSKDFTQSAGPSVKSCYLDTCGPSGPADSLAADGNCQETADV